MQKVAENCCINKVAMAGSSDCDWAEIKETKELLIIEWVVAMLGCALFVFVSRVPQLLVPFMNRPW